MTGGIRRIARIGALALACVLLLPTASAMWGLDGRGAEPRYADLVVVGRMDRITRDVVRFRGALFTRSVGRIRVDEVLLAPEGRDVPDQLDVYWGVMIPCGGNLIPAAVAIQSRGVWLLDYVQTDNVCLASPVLDEFFVPRARMPEWRAEVKDKPPFLAWLRREEGKLFLVVRYFNFGDGQAPVPLWQVDGGQVFVPEPYVLRLEEQVEDGPNVLISESAPLEGGDSALLPAHSHTERVYDISALASSYAPDYEDVWLRPTGKEGIVSLAWSDEPFDRWVAQDEQGECFVLFGDYGSPVLWVPTEARLRLLVPFLIPTLIVGAIWLWWRGAHRRSYLCIGLSLGLLWAWLLVDRAFDACAASFAPEEWQSAGQGDLFLVGAVLLLVPLFGGMAAVATRRHRRHSGIWLVWIPWLAVPLLAFGVNWAVAGIQTIV